MNSRTHIDTLLLIRKAYVKLRTKYLSDSRKNYFNDYEILILMASEEPISPKTLSDLLSCKGAQITGYVSRLENLGLLKRRISRNDKRSFNFQLTKLGQKEAKDLLKITYENFQASSELTSEDAVDLNRLLQKL